MPLLKLSTILVPVDFSERSRAALNYAIALASDFEGSLMVLHVLDPLLTAERFEPVRLRQIKSSSRNEAVEQMRSLSREMIGSGVPTQMCLRHGPATDIILAFAAAKKPDLIVMGSQGRTGLNRLLIGSVAERVVRHAHCPVLVVR
jgi:universal stress protein A